MNDPPLLQPALGHRAARASQFRSTSGSPTRQRHADDLLSRLTPRTAVDALRNPSGELKRCMDFASLSKQAFAMRVAVASKNIHEWLEELTAWPWPTQDTSAGFERPPAKRRKLFARSASDNGLDAQDDNIDNTYLGSLLASDVARYERRIREIGQDMEDLNVEEIKSHILHNHIMPLSRPGTPIMSDSLRTGGTVSVSAYAHMDDFTALITATIVQALPNLSKLARLLNTWSVRFAVLRKSSSFLTALTDAEIALKAGWKAMGSRPGVDSAETGCETRSMDSALSRGEYDVMKLVVERKVAKAGQYLDFMLDTMEGRGDTLPEDWIDRMDSVEQDYAEWASTCERQIREAEWATITRETRASRAGSATDVTEGIPARNGGTSETRPGNGVPDIQVVTDAARLTHAPRGDFDHDARNGDRHLATHDAGTPTILVHPASEDFDGALSSEQKQQNPGAAHVLAEDQSAEDTSEPKSDQLGDRKHRVPGFDRPDGPGSSVVAELRELGLRDDLPETTSHATEPSSPDQETNTPLSDVAVERHLTRLLNAAEALDNDEQDSGIDFPDPEIPEPELPALSSRERRGSEASNTSTVVHGLQSSGLGGFSSDPPDQGTPDYHRFRDVALPSSEGGDNTDLPSSPPDFRSSARSMSVSFNDIPTVVEAPEEENETPQDTPLDASFSVEDGLASDLSHHDSPSKTSVANADYQLQQQISDILESIPAKIRLASEPPAINLNPPDFSMPSATRPRVTKPTDSVPPRSYSSLSNLSSRAGTPSFTLAPAKKPRHQQRGNQEIKLYHLSRSNGEPPIKLFIRCVGDNGERVMVRVGGGWADLGEYLKEYASHHGRRGGEPAKVEVRDLPGPRISTNTAASSSPSRPASAMDRMMSSPVTPLNVRKARRSIGSSAGGDDMFAPVAAAARQSFPKTPLANTSTAADNNNNNNTPSSSGSSRSRSSSRLSWTEEDSELGMAGPRSKNIEMSEERKAWVENVKEQVRIASGDQRAAAAAALALASSKSPAALGGGVSSRAGTPDLHHHHHAPKTALAADGKFGELGKVGSTKRLFRKQAPGQGNGIGTGAGTVGK